MDLTTKGLERHLVAFPFADEIRLTSDLTKKGLKHAVRSKHRGVGLGF